MLCMYALLLYSYFSLCSFANGSVNRFYTDSVHYRVGYCNSQQHKRSEKTDMLPEREILLKNRQNCAAQAMEKDNGAN